MLWFLLTIVAIFFIAIETVIEKKTLTKAGSLEFAASFAFCNALISVPFIFFADFSQMNLQFLGMIFLSSLPSTGVAFLIFKTIKHNQLSEAAPILALSPLFVALFSFLILGEKMSYWQMGGLFLMIGGIIFLEIRNFKISDGIFRSGREKYIFYIFLYLFVGGVSAVFDRVILYRYQADPLTYLIVIQMFIALNFAIFLGIKPKIAIEAKESFKKIWKAAILISAMTVIHRYLYASAIQTAASMGMVVAVYRLSSLFHVFSGGTFFAEGGMWRKIIASLIVIVGTALLVLS